jgi:hypothetical protein
MQSTPCVSGRVSVRVERSFRSKRCRGAPRFRSCCFVAPSAFRSAHTGKGNEDGERNCEMVQRSRVTVSSGLTEGAKVSYDAELSRMVRRPRMFTRSGA